MAEQELQDLQDLPELEQSRRPRILIADDSEFNREYLKAILEDDYDISEVADGPQAIEMMEQEGTAISLLLLDIHMVTMDGFEVLATMNDRGWIKEIPVIIISSDVDAGSIERAYNLGATDYFSRDSDMSVLQHRAANTILLYAKQRQLTTMVAEQVRETAKQSEMMIDILSHIVEFRNGESGLHVLHIRKLTELLLHRLITKTDRYGLDRKQVALIATASALHDIGKISIPGAILNKPGKLTEEEFAIMKTHSMMGATILDGLAFHRNEPLVKVAYDICRWHHERYDGKGYPDGLVGDDIPISAQVVSLADVYDALTSERVYKKAFSHEKAVQMICNGESGSFSPLLIECLLECSNEIKRLFHTAPAASEESQTRLQGVADEMLRREEATTGKTGQLLKQERIKRQTLSSMISEIQFEYTVDPGSLTLSDNGAQYLNLPQVIPAPMTNDKVVPMLRQEGLVGLRDAIHALQPGDTDVDYTCQLTIQGRELWVRFTCKVLWGGEDALRYQGVIGKLVDISDTKTRLDTLEQLASHDPLTNLPNRRRAQAQAVELLTGMPDKSFTLAVLDLDKFKEANDTYGHQFGDWVLTEAAQRLQKVADPDTIVARIGGDEFLVFTGRESEKGEDLELLQSMVTVLQEPFDSAQLSVSIGVARTRDLGRDYTSLFRAADQALYTVKRSARGTLQLYDTSMKDVFPDPTTPMDQMEPAKS